MNADGMGSIWTLAGDETSWSTWADDMAQAPASPLMQELITTNPAQRPGWALDVGCGTGRAFLPLVAAGYRVIGLDPTWNGIRLSRQRAQQAELDAGATLASAARLPVRSGSISFVLALSSLFHLSQPELISALHEIQRVLLPGSSALLHFLDLEDWRHSLGQEIDPEEAPNPSYQAVVTSFGSERQVEAWIMLAGLKLIGLDLRTAQGDSGQQRNWLAQCRKQAS